MNKKYLTYGIIGLLIMVVGITSYYFSIPQSAVSSGGLTQCYSDSDGGFDLYNKGTIVYTDYNGDTKQLTDFCKDSNTLREYNCVDHPINPQYDDVDCVCSNGACESDLCSGKSCPNKCDGNTRLYSGECNPTNGNCEYRQEICSFGCVNARCKDPDCVDNSDCLSNEECKDNVCVEKPECTVATELSDCGQDMKCLDGKCVTDYECDDDDGCEQDEGCKANKCVEKPECEDDSDCGNTEYCDDGKCKESSCTEGEITEYFECSNGDRVPQCLCINGVEKCNENAEELCKQDWKPYIIIGIIVSIVLLISIYSLIRKR